MSAKVSFQFGIICQFEVSKEFQGFERLKVALVGKGGVGKTFVSGTLAKLIKKSNPEETVIAIDADPSMNLYIELGVDQEIVKKITPLCEDAPLVKDIVGIGGGTAENLIINLNPNVEGLIERYAIESPDGVKLLIMGTVRSAGQGCMCPANTLLRALLRHAFVRVRGSVVIDMEAGFEHLGRGTIQYVDGVLNIIEPSMQSIETSLKICRLALELGIRNHVFVANKVVDKAEEEFIKSALSDHQQHLDFTLPYDDCIRQLSMRSRVNHDELWKSSKAVRAIEELRSQLKN